MGGKQQRRRPWTWWLGIGLTLTGISVLGWFAWQFWGTNWVAKRTHERIVEQVHEEWSKKPAGSGPVALPEGDVKAIVHIPRFGGDYRVPLLAGTSDAVLAKGYGHFEESAGPGEKGNFAIAAHRVTHGEPLRNMPDLQVGDEVIVETREAVHTYELITGGDDLEVTFRDTWVVDTVPTNPKKGGVQPSQGKNQRLLTIATCAEIFHTDNRLIAFAELVSSEKR